MLSISVKYQLNCLDALQLGSHRDPINISISQKISDWKQLNVYMVEIVGAFYTLRHLKNITQ